MTDCCSAEHPHTVESPNSYVPSDSLPHWLRWTMPIEPDASPEEVDRKILGDDLYELVVYYDSAAIEKSHDHPDHDS